MLGYVIRRCFIGLVMVIVMSLVTFLLFFASPVDPARYACGKSCDENTREMARKSLGYDQPVMVQWGQFMKGLVVGREYPVDPELRATMNEDQITECAAPCLGYSVYNNKTVNESISEAFPVSASLAVAAIIMWLLGGILLGVLAAVTRGSPLDRGIVALALVAYAFPSFFIGTFLIRYVSLKWGLFPFPEYTPIAEGGVGEWALNLFLPGLTLALLFMAGYIRMTRAFVLESMSEDYVRTARAKGLAGRRVLFKHSLRASLTPLVTMAGLDFAAVLGGAVITETVFNYNGLGKLAVTANATFDLPVLIGLVLLLGSIVIIANIIVDILYAFIDPRVRVG
ncbi:ABC transporter permease [Nocardioides insulae]|uniref:ABC transporter permease n=1 Tax=Nocardioides insulae TaxID=394734 RepID=UPI0003FC2C40|nr:ABC transporter permease [Nocardioides insulae]